MFSYDKNSKIEPLPSREQSKREQSKREQSPLADVHLSDEHRTGYLDEACAHVQIIERVGLENSPGIAFDSGKRLAGEVRRYGIHLQQFVPEYRLSTHQEQNREADGHAAERSFDRLGVKVLGPSQPPNGNTEPRERFITDGKIRVEAGNLLVHDATFLLTWKPSDYYLGNYAVSVVYSEQATQKTLHHGFRALAEELGTDGLLKLPSVEALSHPPRMRSGNGLYSRIRSLIVGRR